MNNSSQRTVVEETDVLNCKFARSVVGIGGRIRAMIKNLAIRTSCPDKICWKGKRSVALIADIILLTS